MTDSDDIDSDDAADLDQPGEAEVESAYGCPVSWSRNQRVIHPDRERWLDVASSLLADGYNVCIDVTGVDYLTFGGQRPLPAGVRGERFEVVAGFLSHERKERIRARVQVPEEDPTIGSLYSIYPGSDALEREVYDLLGIEFTGHPDLSRIMMPEHWEGHPLRKDYATGAIPVQFKGAPASR